MLYILASAIESEWVLPPSFLSWDLFSFWKEEECFLHKERTVYSSKTLSRIFIVIYSDLKNQNKQDKEKPKQNNFLKLPAPGSDLLGNHKSKTLVLWPHTKEMV